MASIRLLRNRIKSVKNIAQITKAMEMVAASKMKKAQAEALAGKAYAQKIYEMVMELGTRFQSETHPLLAHPTETAGKRLVFVVSSNKGLCGSLLTNLFRFLTVAYPTVDTADYISLGKKGSETIVRLGGALVADFSSQDTIDPIPAVAELAIQGFIAHKYDGVDIVFSEFFSALKQQPVKKSILPLTLEVLKKEDMDKSKEFLIEPTVKTVFDSLLPHYIENQIRDAVMQAEASEHSARMVAMRNATDSAKSRIEDLTLMYNKARQEKITYEISDMVTARMTVA